MSIERSDGVRDAGRTEEVVTVLTAEQALAERRVERAHRDVEVARLRRLRRGAGRRRMAAALRGVAALVEPAAPAAPAAPTGPAPTPPVPSDRPEFVRSGC